MGICARVCACVCMYVCVSLCLHYVIWRVYNVYDILYLSHALNDVATSNNSSYRVQNIISTIVSYASIFLVLSLFSLFLFIDKVH